MLTKFGEIQAGTFILINGLFFEATVDFDLYMQTLGFKWANMEGNWNDFPFYLTGRKLGILYREEGDRYVRYSVDADRRLDPVGDPIPKHQCEKVLEFDADPRNLDRTFTADTHAPIRMAMGQLEALVPSIVRLAHGLVPERLTAQALYYLAAGLHDYHISHEVRTILEPLTHEENSETVLRELLALVDLIENRLSRRKANSSIEQHGYAVTGIAAKSAEEESFLYTTGLVKNHGFELCCRSKLPVVEIGELIKYYAAGVHAGKSLDDLRKDLMANQDWKFPKGKAILNRLEKTTNFVYRVQDEFDIYKILIV